MKKITLTICVFLVAISFAGAQNVQNLQDYVNSGARMDSQMRMSTGGPTQYNYATDEVTLFSTLAEFEAECSIEDLAFEDFTGGPTALLQCSIAVSSAGDNCFPAGEIVEGFEITSNTADAGTGVFYLDPSDGFGNTDPGVGSGTFADFTIINFTGAEPVTSFAFDLYALLDGGIVEMRIIDVDGEIETIEIDATSGDAVFVGGISDTPIASIELEDTAATQGELIANFRFGSCGAILTDGPEDAIALTVGGMFSDFPREVDNTEATDSGIDTPSCGDYQGGDSWYTVEVPSIGSFTVETNSVDGSSLLDTAITVYSGEIGDLTEVSCDEDSSDDGSFSLVSLADRTPGEILYIRVYESGNDVQGLYQIAAYSDCAVSAPQISVAGSDLVELSICVGDGQEDFIDVDSSGGLDVGTEGWIIVDVASNTILGLPASPPFEFDDVEPGLCAIYNIRFGDDVTGLEVDGNLDDLGGCFELSNSIMVDRVGEGGVCDTCDFVLELNDSFGDGWNGNSVDILVNGLIVLDDATLDTGDQGFITFENVDDAEISIVANADGAFVGEVSYRILDNVGQAVAEGTLTEVPEPFLGNCLDCLLPEVDFVLIPLCDSNQFIVTLLTSSLSESSQFTVTNNINGEEIIIDAIGSSDYGPFPTTITPFVVSIVPDDADCTISFDLGTSGCPPANDDCVNAIGVGNGVTVIANTDLATQDFAGCDTSDDSLGVWYFVNDGGEAIDVTVDTFGSGYDTVLAFFTGSCDALVCEGSNDDSVGLQSQITFNTGGTGENIYILATGFGASTGDLVVNVSGDGLLSTQDPNLTSNNISIFPNPAINDLTISATESIERVSVYSLTGQLVIDKALNTNEDTLDVSQLTTGMYLVQIMSNGKSETKKFIKS